MKNSIRRIARSFGYEIAKIRKSNVGFHHTSDISMLLSKDSDPVVFDVGANLGQTVEWVKELFPKATLHSFEPSPDIFERLKSNTAKYSGLHLNNAGLGSELGELSLKVNSSSVMSSFLDKGEDCYGEIVAEVVVKVDTLDHYVKERGITHIDLLKIDTQGFDLEVLKGGRKSLAGGLVKLVFVELTFCDLYRNGAEVDEILAFLRESGFRLVSLYDMKYAKGLADWCDGLFLHTAN